MLEKITRHVDKDWDRAVGRVLAHDVTRPGCVVANIIWGEELIWGEDIILPAGTRLTNVHMWTLYTEGVDEIILMNSPAETARARREF
jgi:hypothetical protein